MYELLYTSVASRRLSDSELLEMIERARLNNNRLGITGMLIYDNHEFIQILEGEKLAVKKLYRSIQSDVRHTSVEVFYEGPVTLRSFESWSMQLRIIDEDEFQLRILDDESSVVHLDENMNCSTLRSALKGTCSSIGKKLFMMLGSSEEEIAKTIHYVSES